MSHTPNASARWRNRSHSLRAASAATATSITSVATSRPTSIATSRSGISCSNTLRGAAAPPPCSARRYTATADSTAAMAIAYSATQSARLMTLPSLTSLLSWCSVSQGGLHMKRSLVALLTIVRAACGRDATTAPSFVPAGTPMTDRRSAVEGLFVPGWNQVRCLEARARGKWDPDGDTMDNRCEDALAAAFAPGLDVARDCNYDEGVGRQGGEYYYGVRGYQDGSNTVVRIAYLPAYYWDCGSPSPGPWPLPDICPGCFADGHDGDSEFFIIDVQFNDTTRRWVARQIFL